MHDSDVITHRGCVNSCKETHCKPIRTENEGYRTKPENSAVLNVHGKLGRKDTLSLPIARDAKHYSVVSHSKGISPSQRELKKEV